MEAGKNADMLITRAGLDTGADIYFKNPLMWFQIANNLSLSTGD